MRSVITIAKICLILLLAIPFILITLCLALIAKTQPPKSALKARMVFGPSPIINNKYWSDAMKKAGYKSQTLMTKYSPVINKRLDYDEYLIDQYPFAPIIIKRVLLFWKSLFRFDVFVLSCEGWLLGMTMLWRLEPIFLKLAGKKIIVIPYGSDVHVYRNIRSIEMLHGLLMSYPHQARLQNKIDKRVKLWTREADCLASAILGMDGLGRWDITRSSLLCLDLDQWSVSNRNSDADGVNDTVYIVHAPNHTGFKGTEFVVDAVDKLKQEGLKVELILLQKIQNDEVARIFREEADILVEQLICSGHGLNAVEGMASGLPVICNLEDEDYTKLFRRWSYLGECPMVSADPETLLDQLRALVINPALRRDLGKSSRAYVEKYHSYEASFYLFENILKFIYGERESIINLYHPLIGEYKKDEPKIQTPLINNKIVM